MLEHGDAFRFPGVLHNLDPLDVGVQQDIIKLADPFHDLLVHDQENRALKEEELLLEIELSHLETGEGRILAQFEFGDEELLLPLRLFIKVPSNPTVEKLPRGRHCIPASKFPALCLL